MIKPEEQERVRDKGRSSTEEDGFSEWLVGPDYEVLKIIGQGSYGTVVEAMHKPT